MEELLSLERLLQGEGRIRQVYVALSQRADLADEVRFFCRCMAEEERKDIAMLEESAKLHIDHPVPRVSVTALQEIENSIMTAETPAAQAVLTTDDVLRLALQIEQSTLKQLDQPWIQGFGPTFGGVLRGLAPEPEVRIRRLIEAIHTFSTDSNLRADVAPLWAAH